MTFLKFLLLSTKSIRSFEAIASPELKIYELSLIPESIK